MNPESTIDHENDAAIRILHVEDNPDLADLTAIFLTREDDRFEIETAYNPSEGLDRLAESEFDCIVSDYDMPGQNGIEFLKAVREENPDRPFILFTGKGSEEVASEAISAGVTDYLQKASGSSQYTVLANRVKNGVEQYRANREIERKNRAMDAAPVGITISDPAQADNPLIYVNDRFTEVTEYEAAEIFGSNCRFLQGENTSTDSVAEMREAIDAVEPVTVELLNYRKDRSEFWNRVSIAPVRTDDGELINFVGFQQDITAEKEQELQYERLLELLEHTEEIADVGGWEIDPETEEVFWTEHLFEMLGWEGDDEPPLDEALDVYVDADRSRVESAIEEAIAAGESFDVDARYRQPDGTICWFRIHGEPTIEDGDVVTLRGAVHDITDHKAVED